MAAVRHQIESVLTDEMSEGDAIAIGELIATVWPKEGVTAADRAAVMRQNRGDANPPADIASRSLVIRDGDRVIGHALVFPRTVGTTQGEMMVAALGSVCTAPDFRGQNLGEALVRAAWRAVDEEQIQFSLFQTNEVASRFYKKLGCVVVDNPIVDSTSDEPQRNPFKDVYVMRYPGDRSGWPEGEIDLRGPGY